MTLSTATITVHFLKRFSPAEGFYGKFLVRSCKGPVGSVCSALDGVDEFASMDVPRRILTTPRRQLPVRSLIEGDGQEFRWQDEVSFIGNCVVIFLQNLSFKTRYQREHLGQKICY